MGIQEAHAGALAEALSWLSNGQADDAIRADVPATATFYPADPAIRLGNTIDLRVAAGHPLSGAHVRIDAVRDGDAELLLYDLGGSRILPSIDYLPTHGVLDVHFVGLASADAYARLLSSLRYINRAAHPSEGERAIEISVLDADGAELPVGRLSVTVAAERPAPTAESLAGAHDLAPIPGHAASARDVLADDGPNPFALVLWSRADGIPGNSGIVGWHRAGEDPRQVLSARSAAPAEAPIEERVVDVHDDVPVFGDEALHLYGAADAPLAWDGRGVAALSQADRAAPEPPAIAEPAPLVSSGGYRIFSTIHRTGGRPSSDDAPAADPRDGNSASADAPVFEILRPADVFQTDRPAADTVADLPGAGVPRLDAFLIGLPPSGDPLLPTENETAA